MRSDTRDCLGALLDDAAGHPRSATTECGRMVGMVIPAGMNHQCPARQVAHFQTRCEHRL